jgi:hypothetical protein
VQKFPIQLGSIGLRDFEIPQSVRFGGRHRLTVHSLASGRRIVERNGPDDDDIQFHGTFSGPNAEVRARAFDNLRLSGDSVWLTWETFRRQVIIKSFVADYYSPWWIEYQLSCVVVHQSRGTSFQGASIATQLSSDLSSALSAATGTNISLGLLQTALTGANTLTAGSADQAAAITTVASTLGVVNGQINQQSMMISTPIPSDIEPASLGILYQSKVNSAASLAGIVNVSSYVGRIGSNLVGLGG